MKYEVFTLKCGMHFTVPATCCLFCKHCSDIFYDSGGIYMTYCEKDKDIVKGSKGKCKAFKKTHLY